MVLFLSQLDTTVRGNFQFSLPYLSSFRSVVFLAAECIVAHPATEPVPTDHRLAMYPPEAIDPTQPPFLDFSIAFLAVGCGFLGCS